MSSILSEFLEIKSFVFRLYDKYKIADDRKNYTKAVSIFQNILKDTSKKLETTYYDYVLSPQINTFHGEYRDKIVRMASILLIMYITTIHPTV
jgi:hypothetical protein